MRRRPWRVEIRTTEDGEGEWQRLASTYGSEQAARAGSEDLDYFLHVAAPNHEIRFVNVDDEVRAC